MSDESLERRIAASPERLTIGVMGAAGGELPPAALAACYTLGEAIARAGCICLTGACPGLPQQAILGAKAAGGLTVGISPALSRQEHVSHYGSPTEGIDVLVYTGSGLMGREVTNIRSSDIVIVAGGRSGTLGELAIAYDEGKLIGVLEGTGGIVPAVPQLLALCQKESGAHVIYDADPVRLVARLIAFFRSEHHLRPSVHDRRAARVQG